MGKGKTKEPQLSFSETRHANHIQGVLPEAISTDD
jgi:hypothetical protein